MQAGKRLTHVEVTLRTFHYDARMLIAAAALDVFEQSDSKVAAQYSEANRILASAYNYLEASSQQQDARS